MTASLADAARFYAAREYAAAEAVCRTLLAADAVDFDALHLLGVVLTLQDRAAEAVPYLLRAASVRDDPLLQVNLGNALLAEKRFADVVALALPRTAEALNNLGLALRGLDRYAAAADAFREATKARFDYAPGWFNLATTLSRLGRLEEALHAAGMAMRVAPLETPVARLAELTNEYGRILMGLDRPEEALAACRLFLRRHPDEQSVTWNMSLCLLLLGDFAAGWPAYEYRFGIEGHDKRPDGADVLNPDAVAGRSVLILAEQGRGDVLQFVRYARWLRDRGARVIVQAYPDLMALLTAMDGVEEVVSTDAALPAVDCRTPVMSLPLAFGGAVMAEGPYLRVPGDRVAALGVKPTGLRRIGLVWSGSSHSYDRSAMKLSVLAPLLALPGYEFHALQKDVVEADLDWLAQRRSALTLHGSSLRDFADTAALVAAMDLVISIDTAVAHLTGGLGCPLWVLLPFVPDWRWQRRGVTSPWYPEARLFRQPARGDWDSVLRAAIAALAERYPAGA